MCVCVCWIFGAEWDASEGKGSGWLGPFLWFNMTPLALRLRQLHMHMPAILFVVGDYSAIKAPVSCSVAGAELPSPSTPTPQLLNFWKLSPGLQSPLKTQVGRIFLNRHEWEYSADHQPGSSSVILLSDINQVGLHWGLCKVHYSTETLQHYMNTLFTFSLTVNPPLLR